MVVERARARADLQSTMEPNRNNTTPTRHAQTLISYMSERTRNHYTKANTENKPTTTRGSLHNVASLLVPGFVNLRCCCCSISLSLFDFVDHVAQYCDGPTRQRHWLLPIMPCHKHIDTCTRRHHDKTLRNIALECGAHKQLVGCVRRCRRTRHFVWFEVPLNE